MKLTRYNPQAILFILIQRQSTGGRDLIELHIEAFCSIFDLILK